MRFVFTKYAEKQWKKLDPATQKEIREKTEEMKQKPELFAKNIKRLFDLEPATHRLRIGNYRMLLECDFETGVHLVLRLGHRREIYRV